MSVWGVDHGVEIYKAKEENKSFKARGLAFTDKAGSANVNRDMRVRAGFYSPRSKGYRAQNWKTHLTHTGAGTAAGAAAGAAVGRAVHRTAGGTAVGAALGGYVGQVSGGAAVQTRARNGAVRAGIKNGDIQTGVPKHEISFTGKRKTQSA